MLSHGVFSLIGLAGLGAFLLWLTSVVLSQRKMPEEKGRKPLHTERCATYWRAFGGVLGAGGNLPARISFYVDFFCRRSPSNFSMTSHDGLMISWSSTHRQRMSRVSPVPRITTDD